VRSGRISSEKMRSERQEVREGCERVGEKKGRVRKFIVYGMLKMF